MSSSLSIVHSPIGPILLLGDATGLCEVRFADAESAFPIANPNEITERAAKELLTYFSGKPFSFSVPLNPAGTPFQKQVWEAVLAIPYGKTSSYLDLSLALGDKNLTRAVGSANGKNPLPIFIPCHRIIGSDRSLTGYSGGLSRKKFLLGLEGSLQQQELF